MTTRKVQSSLQPVQGLLWYVPCDKRGSHVRLQKQERQVSWWCVMKVMIAEDDPVSRRILEKFLANLGYSATVCLDGKQAWETYQKGDYRLIISDWMMPEIDGLELVRRVREVERQEYCYFILLTAKTGKTN